MSGADAGGRRAQPPTSSGAPAARSPARRRRRHGRAWSRCPTASAASPASCGRSRGPDRSRTSSGSATPRPRRPRRRSAPTFRRLDLGDYPLEVGRRASPARRADPRVRAGRRCSPTPTPTRSTPTTRSRTPRSTRARALAAGAGVASAFDDDHAAELFLFEPHQPELCNFTPSVFVDITAGLRGQEGRGDGARWRRSSTCRRTTRSAPSSAATTRARPPATREIRQAEAFQRVIPDVVDSL